MQKTGECARKLSSINLKEILTSLPCVDAQTNADRQTDSHALPHSHPHRKCHFMISCAPQPPALYSLLGLITSLSPSDLPPTKSVTQRWHGRHDTWRCSHVSHTGIYIWTPPWIWRERQKKKKKKKAWTSVTARSQADSHSDSHCIFSMPLFKMLSSFWFSHNLSASLVLKLPVCSGALLCSTNGIFVGYLSLNLPAKLHLPDNLTAIG